jgi:hypothetical protein
VKEEAEERAACGGGVATCAERPGDSLVSTFETLTSKLMTLLKLSVELINDICEHAEDGRNETDTLRGSSTSILVCGQGVLFGISDHSKE